MPSFRQKYQQKNLTISALEFEKWSNHKIKALYNVCTTLNSPYKSYSDYSIVIKWLYFVNLPTFQILGQKLSNFFVGILVETMIPKRHFEINWPLHIIKKNHTSIKQKSGPFRCHRYRYLMRPSCLKISSLI